MRHYELMHCFKENSNNWFWSLIIGPHSHLHCAFTIVIVTLCVIIEAPESWISGVHQVEPLTSCPSTHPPSRSVWLSSSPTLGKTEQPQSPYLMVCKSLFLSSFPVCHRWSLPACLPACHHASCIWPLLILTYSNICFYQSASPLLITPHTSFLKINPPPWLPFVP